MCRILKGNLAERLGRNISSWAGILQPRPDYNSTWPDYLRLGRNKLRPTGTSGPGRHSSPVPAGPDVLHPAGPGNLHPGWARSAASRPPSRPNGPAGLRPGRASRPASAPAGPSSVLPRLGRLHAPAGPRLGLRRFTPAGPGRAPPAGPPSPARLLFLQRPDGLPSAAPRLGRIRRIRPGRDFPPDRHILNSGWAGLCYSGWARMGLPWPRPDYLHSRPDYYSCRPRFTPSGIYTSSSSTPLLDASPGTPQGSDWHILLRHMLVLGRPLAQTSISLLSWSVLSSGGG
jgi:hypothetical protein